MATAESSINEFPGDDDDDDSVNETNSSTTVTEVLYSPQWNRTSNMKKIPNKYNKNNKSIVDNMQSNKQSSWCSSKLKISNEEPRSFHRSSSTRTPLNSLSIDESTHQTIFQSNQMPLASYSSSQFTSSDDFLNNNPFVNRLRNPSVAQKYGHSYFDTNKGSSTDSSRNANFETFFPESSTTADSFFDNLESRVIILSFYVIVYLDIINISQYTTPHYQYMTCCIECRKHVYHLWKWTLSIFRNIDFIGRKI